MGQFQRHGVACLMLRRAATARRSILIARRGMAEERRRSRSRGRRAEHFYWNAQLPAFQTLHANDLQTVSDLAARSPCAAAPLQAYYYRLRNPSCVKRASTRWMAVRKEERVMQLN